MDQLKLAVGIPTYSGIQNADSLQRLAKEIPFEYIECLMHPVVAMARNIVLNKFLASDATHLLSLDGDIHFHPNSVQALIDAKKPLIGIAYARRSIDGMNVRFLDPNRIDYVPGQPLRVHSLPLGMMLIERSVLERFIKTFPDDWYDHGRDKGHAFCECSLNRETRGLECDGYYFSRKMREMKEDIWCLPEWSVNHAGKSFSLLSYLSKNYAATSPKSS